MVRHLDEGRASELVVPIDVAVSIRRFNDSSGTTFDAGSVVRTLERLLKAEGKHGSQETRIEAAWDDVQSITISYKHP